MNLFARFSIETTPVAAGKLGSFRDLLRPGMSVYVAFLPGTDIADSVATAKRLHDEGFRPVPHLAARSLRGKAHLDEILHRLGGEAGIDEVLCIAGGAPKPLGEFSDTMQVLETGLLDKHGIRRIGVAGHPEGSPDISDQAIAAALAWKNAFARRTGADIYLLTQFCFAAAPIIAWDRKIRAEGNRLPIRIGIPGLATIKTLAAYARACGIGPSAAFLLKQAGNIAKLMTLSTPDKLIADLAAHKAADPACGIVGCHMYPFGGLKKTAAWSHAVADGKFLPDGRGGFRVTVDLP
ncbi:MAG: methylenetetrahydrofolate reductase [Rhodospirillales bacterium]|nr:methylenetetrahydrofolate reductase [Rhodospirillales bacterium]